MTITFEHLLTNGIRLHTALAGPEDGEPVFLLHGFPDAWFGWEAQIGPLAAAGFRVTVPDQRGYNLSDKPEGVVSYQMDHLVEDVLGLADALGYDRFHLAGHDFGAIVSWNLAMRCPERLERLAITNVPHPAVMRDYLRTHPKQMLKSWYTFFFQLPRLPERVVRANHWKFLLAAMPDDFTQEEQDRYRKAWSQPGATTGMISWYRALMLDTRKATVPARIRVPTLILWGKQDPHISYEMAALSAELCETVQLITFENATHWVLYDEPEATSKHLIRHFSEDQSPARQAIRPSTQQDSCQ
jgi:pimeloyl-ACP methyl ester carboxylesterase